MVFFMGSGLAMERHKQGSVFLFSLFAVAFLASLAATGLTRTMTELNVANRSLASSRAFHLAEAGVDQALTALNTPGTVDGLPWTTSTCGGISCKTLTRDDLSGGRVVIEITDWNGTTPRVLASGFVPNQATPAATRRVEVSLSGPTTPNPLIRHAIVGAADAVVGQGPLWMDDTTVADSYDSRNGPYSLGNPSGNQGSVMAGSTGLGSPAHAYVSQTARVRGDAYVWSTFGNKVKLFDPVTNVTTTDCPGGSCLPAIVFPGQVLNANSLGPVGTSLYPEVPVPAALQSLSAAPALIRNTGGPCTVLAGGTPSAPAIYRFASIQLTNASCVTIGANAAVYLSAPGGSIALRIDATSQLTTQGKTELYFHGTTMINRAISNPTQVPSNLVIYGVYDKSGMLPGLSFGCSGYSCGNMTLVGVLYLPNVSASLSGSARVDGSLIANVTQLYNTAQVNYDIALQNGVQPLSLGGASTYKILSWRDL